MRKHKNITFGVPAVIIMAGILFSCVNNLKDIERVTYSSDDPDEVSQNIEILYTDSGYAQVRIKATLAETENTPKHVTRLKDGIEVDFFEEDGKIGSTLTALYGEVDYSTGLIFVKDSVVLYNYEKQQWLETEELFYNRNDSTIFTNKYVVVKKKGRGITGSGEGIRTRRMFSKYTILKPEARIDD